MNTPQVQAILTDIEGTTSSIAFVRDVLFLYAYNNMARFVQAHEHNPDIAPLLAQAKAYAGEPEMDTNQLIQQLRYWIDSDAKITPLKSLQGCIWADGYKQGDYQAHMYADAVDKLQQWYAADIPLWVYSSGSVKAQHMFFKYSSAGDILHLFQGFFDTQIGKKQDSASYLAISQAIGLATENILFLSDIEAELDAAAAVGMQTYWLVRKQDSTAQITQPTSDQSSSNSRLCHPQAKDFYAIDINLT